MSTPSVAARCGRCGQTRLCFPPDPAWGDVPQLLCVKDWGAYAAAREKGSYVDWKDAFDNASDEELSGAPAGGSAAVRHAQQYRHAAARALSRVRHYSAHDPRLAQVMAEFDAAAAEVLRCAPEQVPERSGTVAAPAPEEDELHSLIEQQSPPASETAASREMAAAMVTLVMNLVLDGRGERARARLRDAPATVRAQIPLVLSQVLAVLRGATTPPPD